MKKIKTTWEVWLYDVWGNEKDGFEVNDRSCQDRKYEIMANEIIYNPGMAGEFKSFEISDKQIKQALGIKPRCRIETDGDDETIYVNLAKNGYPIGELIKVR